MKASYVLIIFIAAIVFGILRSRVFDKFIAGSVVREVLVAAIEVAIVVGILFVLRRRSQVN